MTDQDSARKLLERLSTDDDFRSLMQKDPAAAFAEYGFKLDKEIAPDKQISLPSKQEIGESIDVLSKQMVATNGWIIFCR